MLSASRCTAQWPLFEAVQGITRGRREFQKRKEVYAELRLRSFGCDTVDRQISYIAGSCDKHGHGHEAVRSDVSAYASISKSQATTRWTIGMGRNAASADV